jgi:hypothetical protein
MVPLLDLIWPILLAASAVFLVSGILDRLLPRLARVARVPEAVLAGIRELSPLPGEYVLSLADGNAGRRDAPMYRLAVVPGGSAAARLEGRAAYHIAMSIFIAYLAGLALLPGTEFIQVFRFTTAVAFLGQGSVSLHGWLSERRSWRAFCRPAGKALVCSVVAGSIFAALWPAT